jgi:hypothetical protein
MSMLTYAKTTSSSSSLPPIVSGFDLGYHLRGVGAAVRACRLAGLIDAGALLAPSSCQWESATRVSPSYRRAALSLSKRERDLVETLGRPTEAFAAAVSHFRAPHSVSELPGNTADAGLRAALEYADPDRVLEILIQLGSG